MREFKKQQTYTGQFQDIKGKWYEMYIADLYEYGLAAGVSENAMAPKDPITVAQIVTLAARVNAKYYNGQIGETDGSGKWYEPYISYAIDYGLITEEDAKDPERSATRAECAMIILHTLPDWQLDSVNETCKFDDVTEDEIYYAAVSKLYRAGIITGYEDGLFHPERGISRAEAMTMVDRLVNKSLRYGYNEWWQGQYSNFWQDFGPSGQEQDEPIGVGVGYGRATFLLNGVAMLTIDMVNSNFTLAVYANDKTGGLVTMAGVCEVKDNILGNTVVSCVVTDRVSQGGTSAEVGAQAKAVDMLGFVYDGNRSLQLTEAVVNMKPVGIGADGKFVPLVGMLSIGMTLGVAN